MTKEQSTAEMRYRLSKYVLQVLLDAELITTEKAEIVRTIYRMFVEGMSAGSIAKQLTESGAPTSSGKTVWHRHTIESILQNEKYKGSALLQKKYTVDFLQKKMKVNEGEVPQYYVEHSHPAIIAPEE